MNAEDPEPLIPGKLPPLVPSLAVLWALRFPSFYGFTVTQITDTIKNPNVERALMEEHDCVLILTRVREFTFEWARTGPTGTANRRGMYNAPASRSVTPAMGTSHGR